MKIKASVRKLNKKVLFAVFAVIGAAFTAVRFYQMFALTDPGTGFFTDKGNITVPLYYVLWGVTVLGAFVLYYLSADCETGACGAQKNIPHALASILFGGTAACHAWTKLGDMLAKAGITLDGMLAKAGMKSFMNYIKAEKQYVALIGVVFGFLTAVVLLIDAAAFLTGKDLFAKLKLCHLFPVLWLFCITVNYFSITVSYLNVTQLMLMIFADGFLMVFLFEFARFLCDIGANEAPWMLFASGTIAEVFLCASALPNLALTLTGKSEMLVEHCPMNVYDLAAVLFVATGMLLAAGNKTHSAIRLDPVETAPENEGSEK